MNLAEAPVALVLVGLGVVALRGALRGIPAVAEVLRSTSRPIKSLGERDMADDRVIDIEGTLDTEAPVENLAGVPAVFATTEIWSSRGRSDSARAKKVRTAGDAAILRDGPASCDVTLIGAVVLGQIYEAQTPIDQFLAGCPAWAAALCDADAGYVRVVETVVPVGARVLVSGAVVRREAEPDGYRGEVQRFTLGGTLTRKLLVAEGTRARFLARALFPVVGGMLLAAWLFFFGALGLASAFLE